MLIIKNIILSLALGSLLFLSTSIYADNTLIIGKKRVLIKDHKSFQEGKFLKVTATFENDDDNEVEGMVYQIEWLDSRGIMVDQTSWKPFTIIGKQQIHVVDMANRPDVTDYRIVISTPNK